MATSPCIYIPTPSTPRSHKTPSPPSPPTLTPRSCDVETENEKILTRLPEVRVRRCSDSDETRAALCRLCRTVIAGVVCEAGSACDYHYLCAARKLHIDAERGHERRQRRRLHAERWEELQRARRYRRQVCFPRHVDATVRYFQQYISNSIVDRRENSNTLDRSERVGGYNQIARIFALIISPDAQCDLVCRCCWHRASKHVSGITSGNISMYACKRSARSLGVLPDRGHCKRSPKQNLVVDRRVQ